MHNSSPPWTLSLVTKVWKNLSVKTKAKESIDYVSFTSCLLSLNLLFHSAVEPIFSLFLLLHLKYWSKLLLLSLMSFAKFSFSWSSFFCHCSCPDNISAFFLSSCSCFCFLYVLPLRWSLVIKSLLSWICVLIVFLSIWTDHSCAWKRLSLKTCQLSWALFVFRAHSHRIAPTSLE